ncbi:uncharacterized protein LOC120842871 [Ixodes scapularis]|uniref:uncharacterized protein LOC120842871 n=1 Tax=Ixodes scapularis TaxID=6945 RepID=UPI001A9EA409|nr:uncharacterized protein LOC120842871 [Ixodes scapularis]
MTFHRCFLCPFFAEKLTRVVTHIAEVHSSQSNFVVRCGVDGCCQTYKVFQSYRSHLYRHHRQYLTPSDGNTSGFCDVDTEEPEACGSTDPLHSDEGPSASPRNAGPTAPPWETFDQFVQGVQKNICMFFFKLAEEHKVPHATSEKIFGDFQCLLETILSKYAKQAQQAGEIFGANDPKDSRRIFGNEFPGCLFEQVKSTYQREQFAMGNLPYVKPEEHSLANPQSLSFQYVPIGKVIKNLLQVPELSKHLLQETEQETTEPQILRCFRDGKAIKEVHNEPVHMLHILLYTDELGITNPLGAKQKRHKLLVVYFSVLNLHPRYRSELKNIHLTLMAKYQDVEREGLDKLLQPLLHDLNELNNNGLQVQMQGSIVTVKVAVVGVCGDNLSLNKLVNPALKKMYGVTGPSPMLALGHFDVTKQLMPDLMHDLFEGGVALVLHHVLQGLVSEGTLELADFKKVAAFKGCLFRLLPQMLASNLPEGNAHWDLYLRYREIVDMVLATEVPAGFLPYLEDQIQDFLRAYHDLYPSASVTAKLHYMVHYPRIISEFGPLRQFWCMRFEEKHQYFKSMASKVKNFRNICKTLTMRHQLLESYRHQTYVLDKPLSALGSRKVDPGTLPPCAQSLASKGQVWEAKSISTSTGDYRRDAILVMDKTTSLSFAQVTAVYIIDGDPILLLEALQVEAFRRHKYSFKVHRTGNFYLRKPGEEVCSQRLDLYLDGELVPKWDLFFYP